MPRESSREIIFVCILVFWICLLLYFNPRLLALLTAAPDAVSKIAVVVFTLCLNFIWLYTVYHTVMISMSLYLRRRYAEPILEKVSESPSVAILYPTRNDFSVKAVQSCLDVRYPKKYLFILDDSTQKDFQFRIDAWANENKDNVTVIRRPIKHGYKAGNLNFALDQIKDKYPYFVVCDADGILPADFIGQLLPYFYADRRIAFVQSLQKWNSQQKGYFARTLGYMIEAHYRFYVKARNYYGFVMFYGHGALLKTSVWKEAGGFPEIASEDLAYSARIRELGYQGIYTERVSCLEDFPPGLPQLRVRSEKWIRGTSEFLKLGYLSFVRSSRISWYEKLDVLINAFSHYQSAVMLTFLLTMGALLPMYFNSFRYPGSFFLIPVPYGKTPVEYLFHIRYHIFWSLDFYLIMLASIVIPLVPAIIDLRRNLGRMLTYISFSTFIFLSCLVVETADLLVFLFTGKAVFRNTMDAAATAMDKEERTAIGHFHPNHPVLIVGELLVAFLMVILCLRTKNLWFMSPAVALVLGPIICRRGLNKSWIRIVSWGPFFVTLIILFLVTLDLIMVLGGNV